MKTQLRSFWLIVNFVLIAWAHLGCERVNSTLSGECSLIGMLLLAALNAPLSAVWWILVNGTLAALRLVDVEVAQNVALDLIVLGGFVIVGYYQWFVLLPTLLRKMRGVVK